MFLIGLIAVSRSTENRIFCLLCGGGFLGQIRAYLLVVRAGRGKIEQRGGWRLVALILRAHRLGQGNGERCVFVSWQTAAFSQGGGSTHRVTHLQEYSWKLGVISNYIFLQSQRLGCCVNGIGMYAGCMCRPRAVSRT